MEKEPLAKLVWHGDDTVAAVRELLDTVQRIEITLPANYNHALFTTLHPDDDPVSGVETIEMYAGPELLKRVAQVRGLEPMAALGELLLPLDARVYVRSPPVVVIDTSPTP